MPGRGGGTSGKRCPECGVEIKAGVKYCDFCGTKVLVEPAASAPGTPKASGPLGGILQGLAVVGVAIGVLVYVGNQIKEPVAPPAPLSSVREGKNQAVTVCESAIKRQAPAPFRVIAFRSALVAVERAGYVVSGSVELQSLAGEVQRKRYFCRVQPDGRGGMVPEQARLVD